MDIWDDGQPDGPAPQPWKKQPQPPQVDVQPHGYFEPSKYSLIDGDSVRRRKHWHTLLADNVAPHELWWKRLMRFLKARG